MLNSPTRRSAAASSGPLGLGLTLLERALERRLGPLAPALELEHRHADLARHQLHRLAGDQP